MRVLAYAPSGAAAFLGKSGVVFYLNFTVSPTAAEGTLAPITFAPDRAANVPSSALTGLNWHSIAHTRTGGQVTVGHLPQGAPDLGPVADAGQGRVQLQWWNPCATPFDFLGFAWDVYGNAAHPAGGWVERGWNNTLWYPYAASATSGTLELAYSGAYHAWISNFYSDGAWLPCLNPWTGIMYSGTPHTPISVGATDLGGRKVRLQWKPEIFGTWHNQIIAWNVSTGQWVELDGPSGHSVWQFLFFPSAEVLNGSVDLTVPTAGAYWFFIRGASWLPPYNPPWTGELGGAYVVVGG